MNKKAFILLAGLILFSQTIISAQSTHVESFFLTNSPTAYRYNPAFIYGSGFLSIGQLTTSSRANVGATDFLYDRNNKTVTGLHENVDADVFLNNIEKSNHILQEIGYNLFAYGFARNDAFHIVEVNIRERSGIHLPKDIFKILKTGFSDMKYNFSDTRSYADLFAELTYSYSRQLTDIVSVGARTKLLVGLGSYDAYIDDFRADLGEDGYPEASFSGSLYMTARHKSKNNGTILNPDFESKHPPLSFPSGAGLALDLGVLIRPNDYLTLSASVADLGFLCWFYSMGGSLKASFSTKPMNDFATDEVSIDSIVAPAVETLQEIQHSAEVIPADKKARFNAIPFGFDLGLKYAIPDYTRLSVGLTGHLTTYRCTSYWDTRFGVTVNPIDWLDLSGNVGYGTYGVTWGVVGAVKVENFRLNFALLDTFGGKIPRTSIHLNPWTKVLSVGLTYDLF